MEKTISFNELDFLISSAEISEAISCLKCNKSPGLDNISNHMIKYGQTALLPCLKNIFNACLSHGLYPKSWGEGYITVIHKTGDTADTNNYRGITITSAIGKLFNSILNRRLDLFLKKYNIINDCQIGFSKKARTSDHMFILRTLFESYCSKGERLYACFIDFRKAFDTVIHEGIKFKLLQTGIGTKFYNVIKSMYSVSRSCIKLNNELTETFPIKLGVKQGDNLSPNLFKIFINDLPNYFSCITDGIVQLGEKNIHCLLYADDVVLLSKSSTGLQQRLHCLEQFCKEWCLDVNISKTKILIFNKAGRHLKENFTLATKPLECVTSYKYLGIHFTASGAFSLAQDELYKKATKALFKLQKEFLSLNPSVKTALHVFDHTIKPIILYGSEIWGAVNTTTARFRNRSVQLDELYTKSPCEKLHLKFCRYILGVNNKSTKFAVLSELGRHPMGFSIVHQILNYWHRLENLDETYPLLKAAYSTSKSIFVKNKQSWYGLIDMVKQLLPQVQSYLNASTSCFKAQCKQLLKSHFLEKWLKKKDELSLSGKLDTYCTFKHTFGIEPYLSILEKFEHRKNFTKFRISSHKLMIEKGRYHGIPREERLCLRCDLKEIEDEIHFVFHCPHFAQSRRNLLSIISANCIMFNNMAVTDKLFWLMNCEDVEVLRNLSEFVNIE